MLKKLDIYILRKFLGTFFFIIAVFILIAVVFDISEKIDDFLEGKTVADAVVEKLLYIYTQTQHKRIPIPTIYDVS